jgi:hypothetical protein
VNNEEILKDLELIRLRVGSVIELLDHPSSWDDPEMLLNLQGRCVLSLEKTNEVLERLFEKVEMETE